MSSGIDSVAIYAAIVATIALAWRIYTWLHERRPRIKVDVSFAWFPNIPGIDSNTRFISIIAMNTGRQPTTISRGGYRTTAKLKPDLQIIPILELNTLPHRLSEGESCHISYEEDRLKQALYETGAGVTIKFAWVNDQANRLYTKRLPKNIRLALQDSN